MKNIIVTLINGEQIETLINGTEKEIIKHYNENNFYGCSSEEYTQVQSIEFLYGENKRIYLFDKVDNNLYLY